METPRVVGETSCQSNADVLRELDQLAFRLLGTLEDRGFLASTIEDAQRIVIGAVTADVRAVLEYVSRLKILIVEAGYLAIAMFRDLFVRRQDSVHGHLLFHWV